jgi:hypothetical protein
VFIAIINQNQFQGEMIWRLCKEEMIEKGIPGTEAVVIALTVKFLKLIDILK